MDKVTKLIFSVALLVLLIGGGVVLVALDRESSNAPSNYADTNDSSITSQLPADNQESANSTSLAGSAGSENSDTPTNGGDLIQDEGTATNSSNYTIDMRNFEFSIKQIKASPGEVITVNVTNSGGSHNFVIAELNLTSRIITAGESDSVTFTIPEDAGGKTFEFFCSVGSHRAQGMVGQVIVSS